LIVSGEPVGRFVSDEIGFGLCPPFTTMGIERDGKVVAGVIFSQFEGCDVHITVAGKGWTRGFLEQVGDYVFGQLGCIRATLITEQPHVVGLAIRLGGQVEGCMRDHFGEGRNGTIIGVLKRDYAYVRKAT
jgi:hypothetical protein